MPNAHSPARPSRARTSVPTYNLKLLTRKSRRKSQVTLDNDGTVAQESHSNTALGEALDESSMNTPEKQGQSDNHDKSSDLTSPKTTPSMSAFAISPAEDDSNNATTSNSAIDERHPAGYDCFSPTQYSRGHFYSAIALFNHGVWIGYLDPSRRHESFRGLPSFTDLKINQTRLSPPYPPTLHGIAKTEHLAICRGCVQQDSTPIALRELQFSQNLKLIVMPLDGEDEAGMFCIMLPHPMDKSMKDLQSYRPYELNGDGRGGSFSNRYNLLALHNSGHGAGTLETVLEVLPPKERTNATRRSHLQANNKIQEESTMGTTVRPPQTMQLTVEVEPTKEQHEGSDTTAQKRGRLSTRFSTTSPAKCASELREHSSGDETRLRPSKRQKTRPAFTQRLTSASPQHSDSNRRPDSAQTPSEVRAQGLTDDQANRVYLVWSIHDEGIKHEFVHTLYGCKTFSGLLKLLDEDTEAIPTIAEFLTKVKTWRLVYQLAQGVTTAAVIRKGSEDALERLRFTLAQSTVWSNNTNARIEISLEALSRPNSG